MVGDLLFLADTNVVICPTHLELIAVLRIVDLTGTRDDSSTALEDASHLMIRYGGRSNSETKLNYCSTFR